MKIGAIIGLLFASRDAAHRAHLATTSYAEHMALGDFYPAVVTLADSLAEAWQGRHELVKVDHVEPVTGDIKVVLQKHLDLIEKGRAGLGNDTALQNIVDEVVSLYLSTLYKLRFLR